MSHRRQRRPADRRDRDLRGARSDDAAPACLFLSIAVFRPEDRGHGLGTDAVRVLCDWLFRSAGAERIESSTMTSAGVTALV